MRAGGSIHWRCPASLFRAGRRSLIVEYPRPQLRRAAWRSLDGPWQAMLDDDATCADPTEVSWDRTIIVPYPPEARASGVHDRGYRRRVWYRRQIQLDPSMAPSREERLM